MGLFRKDRIDNPDFDDQAEDTIDVSRLSYREIQEAYNLTAEQRRQYYDYRFEPVEPGYGNDVPDEARLWGKDSYTVLLIRRAWKLAIAVILTLILLGICQSADWGFESTKHPLETASIAQTVALKEEGIKKKFTSKQRAAMIEELTKDSLATAQLDSITAISNLRLMSRVDRKDGFKETLWLKKTIGGYIWLIVVLSPLLVWLFVTLGKTNRLRKNRRAADLHNSRVQEEYARAAELYRTRPSDTQMILFILKFLSEAVDAELAFHGKNEKDLKGKTLFLNEFFDYREDGENYEDSAIEYKIALLEADSVLVIGSDWHVYEDRAANHTVESVPYADIKEVKLTGNTLYFGGITIEKPEMQAFSYQNEDPGNELTFSDTRTSDLHQFAGELRKLQTAYKKKQQ